MYILSPTHSASDMTSSARPSRHVHIFTYALSFWYDLNSQTTSTCTYFHLHPQLLIRTLQSDLLDMYILSPTPSASDMTSTVRPPLTYKTSASGRNVPVKQHRYKRTLACKIFRGWQRHPTYRRSQFLHSLQTNTSPSFKCHGDLVSL